MCLRAESIRYSSATIRATELSGRSTRFRTPHDSLLNTNNPGTDGMIISTGSLFATADSLEPERNVRLLATTESPGYHITEGRIPRRTGPHRKSCEQDSPPNDSPSAVSMNTGLTFHRSGTGPAGRRAGRVPSLPIYSIHAPLPGSRWWR